MRKVFVKRSFIICLLLVILAGVYYYRASKRIYIDLEYLGYVENVDTSSYGIKDCPEFTWWEHFTWWEDKAKDSELSTATYLLSMYRIKLPEGIDWEKNDIVISFGRELKTLYYHEEWVILSRYVGRPVFMKEYKDSVAYIYLIDKTDLWNNQFNMDDMSVFNVDGKVPFTEDAADKWLW